VPIGRNRRAGQRLGVASGRLLVLARPAGGGEIGLVELVLGRPGRLDGQHTVPVRQQDDGLDAQHRSDLMTVAQSSSSKPTTPVSLPLKA
jgi:hypothetical protein